MGQLTDFQDATVVDDDGWGGEATLFDRELGMDCHAEEVVLKCSVTLEEVPHSFRVALPDEFGQAPYPPICFG